MMNASRLYYIFFLVCLFDLFMLTWSKRGRKSLLVIAPPIFFFSGLQSDASDLDLENVTFAPKDVTPVSLTSKDNVHGLGYCGLDPRSALPGTHISLFEPPAIKSSRSGKGIRGQVLIYPFRFWVFPILVS